MVVECIICGKPGKECGELGTIKLIYCKEHQYIWNEIAREMRKAHKFIESEKIRIERWKKKNDNDRARIWGKYHLL
jgi:hypothetical protein